MRIAIIAALPGELKPLVRDWPRSATGVTGTKKWVLSSGEDTWIAVCAGMGADAAGRAYATAASDGPLDMLLSVGWAGSLNARINPGTVHVPTVVIDAQTGEQFNLTEGGRKWRLVTTARVADAAEKTRLAATYQGAVLVDMEAATVARLAAINGIPLLCIKGVSDAAGARLPDLNPFIDRTGKMQLARFISHIALRPWYWPSLLHLGKNSARTAEAMRDLILEFMKEKDVKKLIRTGSL
jgi:adenosylhomocysteine nucleosidase